MPNGLSKPLTACAGPQPAHLQIAASTGAAHGAQSTHRGPGPASHVGAQTDACYADFQASHCLHFSITPILLVQVTFKSS